MFKNRTFKAYLAFTPIVVIQTPDHAEVRRCSVNESHIKHFAQPSVAWPPFSHAQVLLSSAVNLKKPFFYTFTIPWLGPRNLLYVAGDVWRSKRKVQTPGFHFKILEKFMSLFNEHADVMSECLGESSSKKELVRISEITKRCSLDVITGKPR